MEFFGQLCSIFNFRINKWKFLINQWPDEEFVQIKKKFLPFIILFLPSLCCANGAGKPLSPSPKAAMSQKATFNFKNVDIKTAVKLISTLTGNTYEVDKQTSGRITIESQQPLAPAEIHDVFASALQDAGFKIARRWTVELGEGVWQVDMVQDDWDLTQIMTQITIDPILATDGKPAGFKIFYIRPGSLFSQIGLKNQDIISEINGVKILKFENLIDEYLKIKTEATCQIEIIRRETIKTFTYKINNTVQSNKIYKIESVNTHKANRPIPARQTRKSPDSKACSKRRVLEFDELNEAVFLDKGKTLLANQVRVVPNFTDGQHDGFKVFAIRPGSLFVKIGLQNQDIIKQLNGIKLASVEDPTAALDLLKHSPVIFVDLLRKGKPETIVIEIRGAPELSPIWWAVFEGDNDKTRAELESGANPNLKLSDSMLSKKPSLLYFASSLGFTDIVKTLIEYGANIDFTEALSIAIEKSHSEVVDLLLSKESDISFTEPLRISADLGHIEVVDLLLNKGADINSSFIGANLKGAKALLDKGANINARDSDGNTALTLAARTRDLDLFKFLLKFGANTNSLDGRIEAGDLNFLLQKAVNLCDRKIALLLIEKGADVNSAMSEANLCGLQLLLDAGAHIDAKDDNGDTALIRAAEKRDLGLMYFLLEKGANVNTRDNNGQTALIKTIIPRRRKGRGTNVHAIMLLLGKGADVNIEDNDGQTAQMIAAKQKQEQVVELLTEAGAQSPQ